MNFYCGISAIALLATTAANAQEADTSSKQRVVTELQEIVVSGGLSPIELRKSGRSVSVITAETLEKNQVKYAVDALRLIPGVHVSRSGNTGGQTVVRLRGGESNQTLVVIDGVAMNDVDQGAAYFENLLASDIEQIEVLRGPQSALWGSNAMSGVINITTKSGEQGKPKSSVLTEIGSNQSWLTTLSTRGGAEAVRYALSGTFNRVNGFNIATIGDENDRDRNGTINGKLSVNLNDGTTLDTSLRWVDRKSDYDDTDSLTAKITDADFYLTERSVSSSIMLTNKALDERLTQKLSLTGRDQDRDNFDNWGASLTSSKRYTADYSASYRYDELDNQVHQLTGGYQWLQERYHADNMANEVSRQTRAAVAEYRGEFYDRLFLTAGLRREWNSTFDDHTTWNVSADWKIAEQDIRLHSAVGNAVTKPTFIEQFGWGGTFVGNPNLKPEKSFGWDIGIEKAFFDRSLVLDITYFRQNLTNEISGSGNSVINNDGESHRQGIELSALIDLTNGFSASASYTYTDAQSQKASTDPRLPAVRRPKHSGSLTAAYVFDEDRARIFTEVTLNGSMPDNYYIYPTNYTAKLGGYTVVNIGGSYKVSDTVEVFGRIENLFDKNYTEVYGYNTPGITAFAGLKASF